MALGAISIPTGVQANTTFGNKKVRIRNIVLTTGANYTTGGEAITPAAVGLSKRIELVVGTQAPATAAGATTRTVGYDYTNGKLQVYTTASAEAANNSDQSAFTTRLMFIGV